MKKLLLGLESIVPIAVVVSCGDDGGLDAGVITKPTAYATGQSKTILAPLVTTYTTTPNKTTYNAVMTAISVVGGVITYEGITGTILLSLSGDTLTQKYTSTHDGKTLTVTTVFNIKPAGTTGLTTDTDSGSSGHSSTSSGTAFNSAKVAALVTALTVTPETKIFTFTGAGTPMIDASGMRYQDVADIRFRHQQANGGTAVPCIKVKFHLTGVVVGTIINSDDATDAKVQDDVDNHPLYVLTIAKDGSKAYMSVDSMTISAAKAALFLLQ